MTMQITRRWALAGLSLALWVGATPALAGSGVSAWADGLHAKTRLIASGAADMATWRAGIQIRLDEGFKTYWRTPGSSGVPPVFDFSKSRNLKEAKVLFPAPISFPDGVGNAIGYKDEVILPIVVRPENPAMPVDLVLKMDYAVCEKLCIPVQANASLTFKGRPAMDKSIGERLAEFEARVPKPLPVGAPGPLAVLAVEKQDAQNFVVTVRTPTGIEPEAFAEGASGWYYEISKSEKYADARRYHLSLVEKPSSDKSHETHALLTLVTPGDAIETELVLPLGPKH